MYVVNCTLAVLESDSGNDGAKVVPQGDRIRERSMMRSVDPR